MSKSSSIFSIVSILCCVISSIVTSQSIQSSRRQSKNFIDSSASYNAQQSFLKSAKLDDLVFNIVKDDRTNELFVGGRNHIYKLNSEDLSVIQNTTTGPAEHHPDCKPHPETCHRNRTLTNNDNKILLVYMDKKHYSKVLSCGTTHQGMCYLHQKNQLDTKRYFGSPAIVNNFLVSSTNSIGFLANVPYENDSVIFVGNQYDGRNLTLSPPLISSKKLLVKTGVGFEHTHEEPSQRTSVDIDPFHKAGYEVTFVTGFSDEFYAYFVTTSPVSYNSADHETRISRVCLKDKSFKSFSEIPILCEDSMVTYNLATSAFIGTSKSSKVKDVLYVSFMHALSRQGSKVDQKIGSAICSFNMSQISSKFSEVAKECSEGGDGAKVSTLYLGSRPMPTCVRETAQVFDECSPILNYYIEAKDPTVVSPMVKLPSVKITSLTTTTSQAGSSAAAVIAIVGTSEGEILKILLDGSNAGTRKETTLFRLNASGSQKTDSILKKQTDLVAIRPSTAFDSNQNNLFLLSGRSVFKFPVNSCSIYTSCGECLSSNDPLECGWCDGKCANAKECPSGSPDRSTCTPVIYDFQPKRGPTHGGTPITIFGDNFGSLQAGEHNVRNNILLGDDTCEVVKWEMSRIVCRTRKSMSVTEAKLRLDVNDTTKASVKFDIIGSITSKENFEFVDPIITGIAPKFGPQSGGTNLTLIGQNLDAGALRKILIGSSSCQENANNGKNLSCVTGNTRKSDIGAHRIQLFFDGSWSIYSPENFTYKSNPEITRIHPTATIASGGVTIFVEGSNLDSLASPRMSVRFSDSPSKEVRCAVINSTVMTCPAPPVWDQLKPQTAGASVTTDVTFSMDGNPISTDYNDFKLKYYKNPDVYPFEEIKPVYLQDPVIEVTGSNLRPDFEMNITAGVDKIPCQLLESSSVGNIKCKLLLTNDPNIGDALEMFYTIGDMGGSLGTVEFVNKPGPSSSTFIIVTVVFLVLLLLVLLVFCCLKKQGLIMKKKKHPSFSVEYRPDGQLENDYGQNYGRNGGESGIPLIGAVGRSAFAVDDETMAILTGEKKLIAREYLTIGDTVGKGHFGCVCEGNLFDPETEQNIQVAIKTLQANSISSYKDVEMFVKEALIMKDFNHERVLNLIGVTFSREDNLPLVVIPFMKHGDLLSYIRNESNDPTVKDLITFAVEIAEGMEYLASQKCVHRDLAARNCMLDKDRHVKVADFGLSRDVYEQEYYRSAKESELPVKWMAPESLEKGSYSSKSDVWSYGVTVWELMTRGIPPYPQIAGWEIGSYIRAGHRLPQTDCCPNQLYDIMLTCWLWDPKERPTFSKLVHDVTNVITTMENYSRSRVVTKDINYINFPPTSIYANEFESEVLNAVAPIMEQGAVGGHDEEEDDPTKIIGAVMKQKKIVPGESSWC